MFLADLQQLADEQRWTEIQNLKSEIDAMAGTPQDRAWALHILGRAYWNIGQDPFSLAASIRCARQVVQLDHLDGRALKSLGTRLITVGQYREGIRTLRSWIDRYDQWAPEIQAGLVEVHYTLGYAARYTRHWSQAELWYTTALDGFQAAGNTEWIHLTSCALAQVKARMGKTEEAWDLLDHVPTTGPSVAYRLKAAVEILAANGHHHAALHLGDQAAEALVDLNDPDPWELAELHTLLADLQSQAGNLAEQDLHLSAAMHVMRGSLRHDTYTVVCLLLDRNGKEVEIA